MGKLYLNFFTKELKINQIYIKNLYIYISKRFTNRNDNYA